MLKNISSRINIFFLKGHERTLLVKKNIIISLVLKGVTIAVSLLLVPLTIKYVNPVQYGVWLTLSSIIGWFNFLDIGLGHGLKNKLATSNALGETKNSRIYISTTYAIIGIIAVCVFFLFFISNFFLDWGKILNTQNTVGSNLNTLALIVFSSFCIQLVLQLLYSVLTAFHAVAKVSLIGAIGQICCLISIYILTIESNGSLLYLVILLTGIPLLIQIIANVWYFKTTYSEYTPTYKLVDFKYAKSLLSVGGIFFFIQIGSLLLFQTDNIIITQLFGPESVTIFNLAYKLFSIVIMIFTIIMTPFWTAFTDAYTKKDVQWIKNVFLKMYKWWIISIIICVILLIASPFIFTLWLGNSVKIPFMLSFTMVIYVIGVCWMTIHNYFVNGIGKIRLQLYLYIVSTIINIPMAIFFGKMIGIIGITISNIVIVFMMGLVLYIQCRKILNNTATGVWNQ